MSLEWLFRCQLARAMSGIVCTYRSQEKHRTWRRRVKVDVETHRSSLLDHQRSVPSQIKSRRYPHETCSIIGVGSEGQPRTN